MTQKLTGRGPVLMPKMSASSGGVGPIVQQWATAGQNLTDSTENTITFDDPSSPGFGAGSFFDTAGICDFSTGVTTITTGTAGYWEWDARCRVSWSPSGGIQIIATLYRNSDVISRTRFQVSVSAGTIGDDVDVVVPVAGVNLVAADTVTLLVQTITADSSDATAEKAFIHGRRIGDAQTEDA